MEKHRIISVTSWFTNASNGSHTQTPHHTRFCVKLARVRSTHWYPHGAFCADMHAKGGLIHNFRSPDKCIRPNVGVNMVRVCRREQAPKKAKRERQVEEEKKTIADYKGDTYPAHELICYITILPSRS